LIALIALVCLVSPAVAQDCTIAAYGDAAGTWDLITPFESDYVSVYVVLFAEDTVAAAAYSISFPSLGNTLFLTERNSGPSGSGLVIDEPGGTNVALAECVVGFGGLSVLVDEYVFFVFPGFNGGPVPVGPNLDQGPTPVYVTCNDLIRDCEVGPMAIMTSPPLPAEARSFGAIKALYYDD
jgi:hypothetical protein